MSHAPPPPVKRAGSNRNVMAAEEGAPSTSSSHQAPSSLVSSEVSIDSIPEQKILDPSVQAAVEMLKKITDDHWDLYCRNFPEQATIAGDHRYDHMLTNYSVKAAAQRAKDAQSLLERLRKIEDHKLRKFPPNLPF
jgi:hypothetical protein